MLEIRVKRVRQGKNSTLSELYIGNTFICYGLEDSVREEKIKGSTAIPAGRYQLKFNRYGAMNGRYKRLFPEWHQGMIELTGIPNFSYVYIHIGNNFSDTAGCLLVGQQMKYFKKQNEYEIRQSKDAYTVLYKRLAAAMEKGDVFLVIEEKELEKLRKEAQARANKKKMQ